VPDGLDGREHVINIVTHGNMGELLCGLVACSVLAQRAEGLMYDEESCGLISADEALQSAREIESLEHERKQRAVEKQASITSRRCPKCASPCPEYRKTCRACGFELGREV
jgi:hypothetical protein